MITGMLFFALANVFAWLQYNSQFVCQWWEGRPLVAAFLFAIPTGLCFWYAIKNVVSATGELWAGKLIGFGVGTIVFAIMTVLLMKESIFTIKTMSCLVLALGIICIQVFWK